MNDQQGSLFGDVEPEGTKKRRNTPARAKKPEIVVMQRPEKLITLDSLEAVESHFDVTFKQHQAETLEEMYGRNSSVILNAPTGFGKSLCFQGASLLFAKNGVTVVIYPLRALVKDQIRRCKDLEIPFAAYYGETPRKQRPEILEAIANRQVSLVLTTPESFARSKQLQHAIGKAGLELLAVDEAHAFEEWSFAFRPAYRDVGAVARRLRAKRVLLCSATFTHFGATEAARVFDRVDWSVVKAPATRPNLIYGDLTEDAVDHLARQLERGDQSGILYFVTVKELLAHYRFLTDSDPKDYDPKTAKILRYYGDMSNRERRETLEEWLKSAKWTFATKALGMGVDKSDIREVIHAQLPASILDYAQESGRAGRDGKPAKCLLTQVDDGRMAGFLLDCSMPSPDTIERVFNLLVHRSRSEAGPDGWFDLDSEKWASAARTVGQAFGVAARWLADNKLLRLSKPETDWKFYFPNDVEYRADEAGRQASDIIKLIREYGEVTPDGSIRIGRDDLEEAIEDLFADWAGKLERMAAADIFSYEKPEREKRQVAVLSTDFSTFDGSRLEDARQRAIGRLARMKLLQATPAANRPAMIERESSTDVEALKVELEKLRAQGVGSRR